MTQQVEVFKTNVQDRKQALLILQQILNVLPNALATFDLEDCDKILRISDEIVDLKTIQNIANEAGIECIALN